MTQPTPPPRCRALVEGKPCGKAVVFDPDSGWTHDYPYIESFEPHKAKLERRVSGERRKLENWMKFPSIEQRGGADRRKAGKL